MSETLSHFFFLNERDARMKVRAPRSGIPSLSTMCVVGMELGSAQVVAGGLDPPSQVVTVS